MKNWEAVIVADRKELHGCCRNSWMIGAATAPTLNTFAQEPDGDLMDHAAGLH